MAGRQEFQELRKSKGKSSRKRVRHSVSDEDYHDDEAVYLSRMAEDLEMVGKAFFIIMYHF